MAVTCLLFNLAYGQRNSESVDTTVLFEPRYYNNYIVNQIRYTVLNQNSNVPGLKVNIGKNEITGTASLKSNDPIQTIDFAISSNSDGLFSLFNNGSFDSKFRIGYNYHYIPYWGSSWRNGTKYEHQLARRQYTKKKQATDRLRDTMLVQLAILKEADPTFRATNEFSSLVGRNFIHDLTTLDAEASTWLKKRVAANDTALLRLADSIRVKNVDQKTKAIDRLTLYQDIKSRIMAYLERDDALSDAQAKFFGPYHRNSTKYWITFSPSVEITPVRAFSNTYDLEDHFSTKVFGRVQLNRLKRDYSKYALFRIGLQAGLTNNIAELNRELYAYSKTKTLVKNDTITIARHDKADAYPKSSIRNGFGANILIEYFQVPAEASLRPGLFVSISPGFNTAFKQDSKVELPAEIGLVFSVLSDEKKAIYLLPYVNFANLARFNDDNRVFKRDWLVGIKVGLPFGLSSPK